MEGHVVNINEIRKMMKVTGDHRILFEMARELDYVCMEMPDFSNISDLELLNRLQVLSNELDINKIWSRGKYSE